MKCSPHPQVWKACLFMNVVKSNLHGGHWPRLNFVGCCNDEPHKFCFHGVIILHGKSTVLEGHKNQCVFIFLTSCRRPQRWCSHQRTWTVLGTADHRTVDHRTVVCQSQSANQLRIKSKKIPLHLSGFFLSEIAFSLVYWMCAVFLCPDSKKRKSAVRFVEINTRRCVFCRILNLFF